MTAVEAQCLGVVSCADILAMAARDCVFFAGGPSFPVELGRHDGLISKASRVAGNLPEPFLDLLQLNTMFAKHNLSLTDVIALSGAHTLGVSHCNRRKSLKKNLFLRNLSFSLLIVIVPYFDENLLSFSISGNKYDPCKTSKYLKLTKQNTGNDEIRDNLTIN
ncbi:hypothetical protein PS2_044297 [Malus domestica]